MTAELLTKRGGESSRREAFGRVDTSYRAPNAMPSTMEILSRLQERDEEREFAAKTLNYLLMDDRPFNPAPEPSLWDMIPGVALGRSIHWVLENRNNPRYSQTDFKNALAVGAMISSMTTGLALYIGNRCIQNYFGH